ncbi:MAG TPA: IS1 family transposase [Bryobacteraceae bacterium]|nr:IS1 family transposase [Bryobacteraceae bacterium]
METKESKAGSIACPNCDNASKRFGKHRNGLRRFRCLVCKKTFTEPHDRGFRIDDYLNDPRGQMVIRMLTEGCSIRTVERLSGIRRDTIIGLLLIAGQRCEKLMDSLRNVPATDIQMDECWNFIYCKEAHKGPENAHNDEIGDCYNWVAIDRPTKLVLAFACGRRTLDNAMELTRKVRRATSPNVRFQLTTDGLQAYIAAVDEMLLDRCDFAQLIKIYAAPREGEQRYSPAEVVEAVPVVISGNPDPDNICTSQVECQNLTMRMQLRRLTRLTNGFSKKLDNHKAAVALHFGYYNFCQLHGSLRVTPAMEAGITDHVWEVAELLL